MTEPDDARIERLTALARKVHGLPACVQIIGRVARVEHGAATMLHVYGDNAAEALDAALSVQAGEPPYLAVALRDAMDRVRELEAQLDHVRRAYETFDEECDLPELRQAIAVALGLKPAEGT